MSVVYDHEHVFWLIQKTFNVTESGGIMDYIESLELEKVDAKSICIFCGTTMKRDLSIMLAHAKKCEKRPEGRLMRQIANLEAELESCKNYTGWRQYAAVRDELAEVYEVLAHLRESFTS